MLLKDWQAYMIAQGRSQKTIQNYRYAILRLMSEVNPPKSITAITEQDIVVFLASLGGKAHSKQLYVNGFKSFFRWAYERGHMLEDPTMHLHPKAPNERPADAFSPEEVGALIIEARKYPNGERHALAIQLCYALGLRRTELCSISPDDIDWSGGRVHIRLAKGAKQRWVEANGIAMDALEKLRPHFNGTVVDLDPNWFTMLVHRAARDAGLPPGRRNAHMLRAAFATALLGEGVPVSVVSRLLGHSKLTSTARYLGVRDQDRRQAVSKLPLGL